METDGHVGFSLHQENKKRFVRLLLRTTNYSPEEIAAMANVDLNLVSAALLSLSIQRKLKRSVVRHFTTGPTLEFKKTASVIEIAMPSKGSCSGDTTIG